jgi:hypothetical protein
VRVCVCVCVRVDKCREARTAVTHCVLYHAWEKVCTVSRLRKSLYCTTPEKKSELKGQGRWNRLHKDKDLFRYLQLLSYSRNRNLVRIRRVANSRLNAGSWWENCKNPSAPDKFCLSCSVAMVRMQIGVACSLWVPAVPVCCVTGKGCVKLQFKLSCAKLQFKLSCAKLKFKLSCAKLQFKLSCIKLQFKLSCVKLQFKLSCVKLQFKLSQYYQFCPQVSQRGWSIDTPVFTLWWSIDNSHYSLHYNDEVLINLCSHCSDPQTDLQTYQKGDTRRSLTIYKCTVRADVHEWKAPNQWPH